MSCVVFNDLFCDVSVVVFGDVFEVRIDFEVDFWGGFLGKAQVVQEGVESDALTVGGPDVEVIVGGSAFGHGSFGGWVVWDIYLESSVGRAREGEGERRR